MTLPFILAIASAAMGFMGAFMALGISKAPGWAAFRAFALCALSAALFNLTNLHVTLEAPESLRLVCARATLFFGGMYAFGWFAFAASLEGKRLSRLDRAFMAGGVLMSLLALVPGLVLRSEIVERPVPFIGVYRDAPPTPFGLVAYAYLGVALSVLFVRFLRGWRRGVTGGGANTVAIGVTLLGFVNDALAGTGQISTPYLLDTTLVIVILVISGAATARLVAGMHALEKSSTELAAAQAELVSRERLAAIGEVAAVVAHEVRNPLAVVFNAIAGLQKIAPVSEDHARLLGIAQEEAERMRDIVSEILDYASPRPPVFGHVDVRDVVRDAVEAVGHVARAGREDVEVAAPEAPLWLECDERLIRRAVINLVENALQAEGRTAPVKVVLEDAGEEFTVSVVDDGKGVTQEVEERLFTPFFTTRPTGTGLGLAVVQRCAEAHGGSARFERAAGGGARFVLRLRKRR